MLELNKKDYQNLTYVCFKNQTNNFIIEKFYFEIPFEQIKNKTFITVKYNDIELEPEDLENEIIANKFEDSLNKIELAAKILKQKRAKEILRGEFEPQTSKEKKNNKAWSFVKEILMLQ